MSAMLARIHDAGSYQAFQHFITHAPWDVAPVWRRLLSRIPDRRGVLILDDTGFPKQGTARWACSGSIGHARQNWQLSDRGHRRAVDGRPHMAARRRIVFAAAVVNARAAPAGTHPGARAVSREMAARADARRSRAARRHRHRAGHGRCGIWRYSGLSIGVGAAAAAVRARYLRPIHRLGRAATCRSRARHPRRRRRHGRRPPGRRPGPRSTPRARGGASLGATAHVHRCAQCSDQTTRHHSRPLNT